jgi:ATP-dependent Clp protease ATP-binding subunit ClpA
VSARLLGREQELDWLEDAIARRGAGVVVGEAGIGKSSLLADERLAHEVAAVPLVVVKSTIYRSSRVHGCNWFFWDASCDVTNIWLS